MNRWLHTTFTAGSLSRAALVQNIPHTLVQVDLSQKPPWFRSVNARGLVPCVSLNGNIVVESLDICRHALLCQCHPSADDCHRSPLPRVSECAEATDWLHADGSRSSTPLRR